MLYVLSSLDFVLYYQWAPSLFWKHDSTIVEGSIDRCCVTFVGWKDFISIIFGLHAGPREAWKEKVRNAASQMFGCELTFILNSGHDARRGEAWVTDAITRADSITPDVQPAAWQPAAHGQNDRAWQTVTKQNFSKWKLTQMMERNKETADVQSRRGSLRSHSCCDSSDECEDAGFLRPLYFPNF